MTSNYPVDTSVWISYDGMPDEQELNCKTDYWSYDESDGKYHAKAVFDNITNIDNEEEGMFENFQVQAKALNADSDISVIMKIKDKKQNKITFIVDKQKPAVSVNYNQSKTKYTINITDYSPISSIEYRWDDLSFKDGHWIEDAELKNNFIIKKEGIKNEFIIDIRKEKAIYNNKETNVANLKNVEGGIHKLYIKVTDMAGNFFEDSFSPGDGTDNVPPEVTEIKFVKMNEDKTYNVIDVDKLPFENNTLFLNDDVSILVSAYDPENTMSAKTGISSVMFAGIQKFAQEYHEGEGENEKSWFIFDLKIGTEYKDIKISASDILNSKDFYIHSVLGLQDKEIKNIVIENEAPYIKEIHFINESNEVCDDKIKKYGSNNFYNEKLKILISVEDVGSDNVVSGMNYISFDGQKQFETVRIDSEDKAIKGKEWYAFDMDFYKDYILRAVVSDKCENSVEIDLITIINEYGAEFVSSKLYLENEKPTITRAEIVEIVEQADEKNKTYKKIKDILSYGDGNYYNKEISILVFPEDIGGSGIRSVNMSGKENGVKTIKTCLSKGKYTDIESGEENECCEFEIKIGNEYSLVMGLYDRAGNFDNIDIREFLGISLEQNEPTLLIENDAPTANIETPNEKIIRDGKDYYGQSSIDKKIKITVADPKVTSDFTHSRSGIAICEVIDVCNGKSSVVPYTSKETDGSYASELTFAITSQFKDGDHTLKINVIDKAGNETTITYSFYVDFTLPRILYVSAFAENKVKIDNKQWFDVDDKIKLEFNVNEVKIDTIRVSVVGEKTTYFDFTSDSKDDDKKIIINKEINSNIINIVLDNNKIPVSSKHTYIIKTEVTDFAGNKTVLDPEMVLYRDFYAPKASKVTASQVKTPNAIDRILNVLSFGVYTNDKIMLQADVEEDANDSGIDRVTVKYDGIDETEMMLKSGTQSSFICYIDCEVDVFKSNVHIVAYDKFGKDSIIRTTVDGKQELIYPIINGTKNNFVMIEKIAPVIDIYPAKGVIKSDGTLWYNKNENISFSVQDVDSGIQNISVKINGNPLNEDSDGNRYLKTEATSIREERINTKQTYILQTDKLIDIVGGIPNDGKFTLEISATDNSGNKSKVQTLVYYIDKIIPNVDKMSFSIEPDDRSKDVQNFVQIMSYGFYFKADCSATIYLSDNTPSSGLKEIVYYFKDFATGIGILSEEKHITLYEALSAKINIPANFKGQLYVKVIDNTGNESQFVQPEAVAIDTPQKHSAEAHIYTEGFDFENSKIEKIGDAFIYNSEVKFIAVIKDTVSGIKEFTYFTQSENTNETSPKIITINNDKVYQKYDNLGDGWIVESTDYNLVTEVRKQYLFNNDDNGIKVELTMKDRANNENSYSTDEFIIDMTAPIIEVNFEGDAEGYKNERKAAITVTDRNINMDDVKTVISEKISGKNLPVEFSQVEGSNSLYKSEFSFGNGDYQFDISGKDICGHEAIVRYVNNNEKSCKNFYVDSVAPKFTGFGEPFSGTQQRLYKDYKTMSLTIQEHNFDSEQIKVAITKDGSSYSYDVKWDDSGDNHTAKINFNEEGIYQVTISGKDKVGLSFNEATSCLFEFDGTKPKFISGDETEIKTTSSSDVSSFKHIQYQDRNIKEITGNVTAFVFDNVDDENDDILKIRDIAPQSISKNDFSITSNIADIDPTKFFEKSDDGSYKQGIYTFKIKSSDNAGNEGETEDIITKTFVIMDKDFLAYIPNSDSNENTGYYQYNNIPLKKANFPDISIVAYVRSKEESDKSSDYLKFMLKNKNTDETYFSDEDESDYCEDSLIESESLKGIDVYNITLKNDFVKEHSGGNFQDFYGRLNIVSKTNEKETISLGDIIIDNTAPKAKYSKQIEDIQWYDGYYDLNKPFNVIIENVPDDIDLSRCEFIDNEKVIIVSNDNYDTENKSIVIQLSGEGNHKLKVKLVDKAGLEYNIPETPVIYIGTFFGKWWSYFLIGALTIAIIITLIVVLIVRARRNN